MTLTGRPAIVGDLFATAICVVTLVLDLAALINFYHGPREFWLDPSHSPPLEPGTSFTLFCIAIALQFVTTILGGVILCQDFSSCADVLHALREYKADPLGKKRAQAQR